MIATVENLTGPEASDVRLEQRQYGPTPRWWPLRYHAEQWKAMTCGARFVGLDAGRGSGKTDIAKRFLVTHLRNNPPKPWPDPRYFYGLPTYQQAKRVGWNDLLKLIPDEWIEGGKLGRNVSRSDLMLTTRWGAELWVMGMDNAARFEGVPWDGGILDEAVDQPDGCFDLHIRPGLDRIENEINRRGWCWIIGKPSRKGPGAAWFRKFVERCRRGEYEDGAAFTWPAWDILPAADIEQMRSTMEPKDFNEQVGACWENAGGAIFYMFNRNLDGTPCPAGEYNKRPCPYRPELPIVVCQDFNMDPMCWELCQKIGNRFECFDEIFSRDCVTLRALDILWGRYSSHGAGWQFVGDAAAHQHKTSAGHASLTDYIHVANDPRFQKTGRTLHYPSANPSHKDRFSACNAMLCNAAGERRAFIDPRCERLIGDLEMRSYKPGTDEPADGKDTGHASDAWGYGIFRFFPPQLVGYGTGEVITTGAR